MPKGGARARSGPAPDPSALRRERDADQWVRLPAAGRPGRTPKWPLSASSKRELELWRREWRRPQAIEWERNGQDVEVALYVRSLVDAESLDASVAARTLVRQQQEALGLSQPGLARNKWMIVADTAPAKAKVERASSSRSRLRVVPGGDGD